ncbi:OmpA family protein [Xanthomonas axonopodis]|uniref:OmpA family protein n=1 Tax=Xanthomonas axonopodis TaxID=53413 RepID=UPI00355786A9
MNGKHRQPINATLIQPPPAAYPTAAVSNAAPAAQEAAQEPHSTMPATTLPGGDETASHELVRVFRFQFPFGGTTLKVPLETSPELLALAKQARTIHLRGRTDGPKYSAGDERVALNRAIAARSFLVTHGVDPTRVRLDYVSGADYLADNSTAEGRSRNRRVEIELQFFDAVPDAVASLTR